MIAARTAASGDRFNGPEPEVGWNEHGAEVDFYDLKGILELVFDIRLPAFTLKRSEQVFFIPVSSGMSMLMNEWSDFSAGFIPRLSMQMNQKKALVLELDLSAIEILRGIASVKFEPLPKFPAVQRDWHWRCW